LDAEVIFLKNDSSLFLGDCLVSFVFLLLLHE
jgi:hypothetical protein